MKGPLWIALAAAWAGPAGAQCADWTTFTGPGLTFGSDVHDATTFAGSLHVGGRFSHADGTFVNSITRWSGSAWTPVGLGVQAGGGTKGTVRALEVFDDGSGPALYATGGFLAAGGQPAAYIARWDGSDWSPLAGSFGEGLDSWGTALEVHDDGSGPALYVGGWFDNAGGLAARRVARWDGSEWSAVPGLFADVSALHSYDDGAGAQLFASTSLRLDVWNGVQWTSLGAYDDMEDFAEFGGLLYMAGPIPLGFALASWDGAQFVHHGAGLGPSHSLSVFDDGTGLGPRLFVGTGSQLRAFDGVGFTASTEVAGGDLDVIEAWDEGGGARLFAGGPFTQAGEPGSEVLAFRVANWDGSTWSPMGTGSAGFDFAVTALGVHDAGTGPELYAGGNFTTAGAAPADRVARWDGSSWKAVGSGFDDRPLALASYDDGSGPALYAGGQFTASGATPLNRIARWDGTQWAQVGGAAGLSDRVDALLVHDDGVGAELYAGGKFLTAGPVAANGIARWDGNAWKAVGNFAGRVRALAEFDDGTGLHLFAAGLDGQVRRWDGASWTSLPSFDDHVNALAVYDDGGGPALYAGGEFEMNGALVTPRIARWDGTSWSFAGSLATSPGVGWVEALAVYDDGSGPRLFATGLFQNTNLAAWDGTSWDPIGVAQRGEALAVFDGTLWAGGLFTSVLGTPTERVARWGPAGTCDPIPYCTAGTTSSGCNARISGAGTASASFTDGFVMDVTAVDGQRQGMFFFGTSGSKATPWGLGSSWVCVKGPQQRLLVQSSGGSAGSCDGAFREDFNVWMTAHPNKAPPAGSTAWVQCWFRDPPSPQTTSFSDALQVFVGP